MSTDFEVQYQIVGKAPSTSRNFRSSLIKLTGENPGKLKQAHHVFPQKESSFFLKKEINIHEPQYGAWGETSCHQKNAYQYNAKWLEFKKRNQTPTAEQILQEGKRIMSCKDRYIRGILSRYFEKK